MIKYILIIALIGVWFFWRASSKRHHLPCPPWLGWMVELDNPLAKAHKADFIIDTLQIIPGMQVLDIGVGPGRVTIPLAQSLQPLNGFVTALDVQAAMLAKVRAKANQLGIDNIAYIQSSAQQIYESPLQYDAVLLVCVLGEIPEAEKLAVMQALKKSLKPEGIISITESIFDPHYQSRNVVASLMQTAGFKEHKFFGNKLAYTAHFKRAK